MTDKSVKNTIKEIEKSKTPPKKEIENDKCDETNIKKCEKENKGRVCNPLSGRCVDKNNVEYKKFLKTLKKPKTPPKEEIEKSKTPPKKEIEKPKTPPKKEIEKSKTPTNKEIDNNISKYKKILKDEILTDEETDKLNEKIEKLMKKKRKIYMKNP